MGDLGALGALMIIHDHSGHVPMVHHFPMDHDRSNLNQTGTATIITYHHHAQHITPQS
jgi:hypothetical protein